MHGAWGLGLGEGKRERMGEIFKSNPKLSKSSKKSRKKGKGDRRTEKGKRRKGEGVMERL
jgi:hypothetical protein